MPLHKILKTSAYHRRLQVKYRRRREGKTDYQARKALIMQDQRTMNTPKHRLVVRITNRDVITQIVLAHINGDTVMCAAYAHELPRYGIKVGLTNYAACYATGLLLARRLLKKIKLDKIYKGVSEATGKDIKVSEPEKGPRPFKAILDSGLARTSTGARIFAVVKGACDGGINVPHSDRRLVGCNKNKKYDPNVMKEHIFGVHVAKYMKELKANDEEAYKKHFSQYIKEGITADKIEAMYKAAHKAIREDPTFKRTEKKKPAKKEEKKDEKKEEKKELTEEEKKQKAELKRARKAHMDKMPLKLRHQRRQQKLAQIKKHSKSFKKALYS